MAERTALPGLNQTCLLLGYHYDLATKPPHHHCRGTAAKQWADIQIPGFLMTLFGRFDARKSTDRSRPNGQSICVYICIYMKI